MLDSTWRIVAVAIILIILVAVLALCDVYDKIKFWVEEIYYN